MSITPQQLHAYLDGELDAVERDAVETALANDPVLAAQYAAQRRLRERLQQAFAPVLDEPVPARLTMATASAAEVVDLASRRAKLPRWRQALATGLALAAALVVGVFLGPRLQPDAALIGNAGGRLLAQGGLERALHEGRSGEQVGTVTLGLSFRSQEGNYCRSFTLRQTPALAGLSCRQADGWQVHVLAETTLQDTALRPAAADLPAAVLDAIDARIDGEPLDARSEAQAKADGWR